MSTGSVIRTERHRLSMSQTDLADRLGVTAGAVSHWESERSTPREDMFHSIARVLGVDVNYLVSGGLAPRIPDNDAAEPEHIDGYIQRIREIVARNNSIDSQRVSVEIKIL